MRLQVNPSVKTNLQLSCLSINYAIPTHFRIQTHRRPAGSHKSAGAGTKRKRSVTDLAGRNRFGKNVYRCQRHSADKQADAGAEPQQNAGCAIV